MYRRLHPLYATALWGSTDVSLLALVLSQWRIIEPELCRRLLPLIWLYNV